MKSEIAIPVILEVGQDMLKSAGQLIAKTGLTGVVVFYGEGIRQMFGNQFIESFQGDINLSILAEYDEDDISIEHILSRAFALPSMTEAVIGLGGGKVLDIAKYTAFLNNLHFISIPTSTSHDGFASSGCSLLINGKRTSVHAKMPYGIIVDTGIIKRSPRKFLYSGIGDIISKITAVVDWQLEESLNTPNVQVNDFAVMMAKKSVNSIARMPYSSITEDFFIKELVDSLTMSGIAMEVAESSAPASGSEHLISHALDKILEKPFLHGLQVGVATYLMSLVQNHRYARIEKFLTDTGFFDYIATLDMKKEDFRKAIDMAPSIKPSRNTTIHLAENREKAKQLLTENEILNRILK